MDLETFFTILYVIIDDWYKAKMMAQKSQVGRPAKLSDSEVITLAIASNWRYGVPWESERGFMRYMQAHGTTLFPNLLNISAFNQRVRYLYGVLVELQHELASRLITPETIFECVDTLELPAYSLGNGSRQKTHWLWQSTLGKGAHGHWIWGDFLLASVTNQGVITGCLIATANTDDRWMLEAFLSARTGQAQLQEPPRRRARGWSRVSLPPVGYIGGFRGVGQSISHIYLADKGFGGERWSSHWEAEYHAKVITVPQDHSKSEKPWSPAWKKWLSSHRQIVESVFSVLHQVFDIKHLNAHSRWGQLTRIGCKVAGFNMGILINRILGRKDLSHATLIF